MSLRADAEGVEGEPKQIVNGQRGWEAMLVYTRRTLFKKGRTLTLSLKGMRRAPLKQRIQAKGATQTDGNA